MHFFASRPDGVGRTISFAADGSSRARDVKIVKQLTLKALNNPAEDVLLLGRKEMLTLKDEPKIRIPLRNLQNPIRRRPCWRLLLKMNASQFDT